MDSRLIEISTGTIFRTILILLALGFLYLVRDVIMLLFISIIVVSALDPIIDWLQKKKISRPIGVLLVYFLLICIIVISISFLIPPIVEQFKDFSSALSRNSQEIGGAFDGINNYLQSQNINFDSQKIINDISSKLSAVPEEIISGTIGIFSGFLSIIIIFSMAFYMLVKENGVHHFIVSIAPEKSKEYISSLAIRIKSKIGKWMQGQLLLMLIIFVVVFAGLLVLRVPYALSLAVFAGIMEIVPYIGPIIFAVPGIILGFLISPLTGVLVTLLYIVAQQFESNVVVPQVMKKAVGLNPVVVILALLVGFQLGGILGAIIAVPLTTAVSVFINDLIDRKIEA